MDSKPIIIWGAGTGRDKVHKLKDSKLRLEPQFLSGTLFFLRLQ